MNFIDIICIVLCVLIIIGSYKRGFVKSMLGLISYVIGIPTGIFVASNYSQVIYDNYVESKLIDVVEKRINSSTDIDSSLKSIKDILENIPSISTDIGNFGKLGVAKIAEYFTESVLEPIVTILLKLIIFVLVLLAFKIICSIIGSLLTSKNKKSIMSKTNHLLGVSFGLIRCVIFLLIVSTISFYLVKLPINGSNNIIDYLKESYVIDFVNQYNPIIDLL